MRYWMIDAGELNYVVLPAQRLDTAVRRAARILCSKHTISKDYHVTFNVRRISRSEYESEVDDE